MGRSHSVHADARVPTPRERHVLRRNRRLLLRLILATTLVFVITSAASLTAAQTNSSSTKPAVSMDWFKHIADGADSFSVLQHTADGGYVVAGDTYVGNTSHAWLAKVDPSGQLQWDHDYGNANATAYSVHETSDGGFILAGSEKLNSSGKMMPFYVKTGSDGTPQWARYASVLAPGDAVDVQQTNNGGYVIVGTTQPSNGSTVTKAFAMKTDSNGYEQGARQLFAAGSHANAVRLTSDGGYVLVGYVENSGSEQAYLVKNDASGRQEWNQTYGTSGYGYAVVQDKDGGFVFCGGENAYGYGDYDAWLVKTDANGTTKWQNNFGGTKTDWAHSLQQTSDGGYILGGTTYSLGNVSAKNAWLVKTDANGKQAWGVYYSAIKGAAESVLQARDGSYVFSGTDAIQASAYIYKTQAETLNSPNSSTDGGFNGLVSFAGSNGMAIGLVILVVGVLGIMGMRQMQRSKRAANELGRSASSAGAITGATDIYQTQPPLETLSVEQAASASPPSFPVELGSQFSQVRYLGEGGFARVFAALNLQGTPVAVKVLKTNDPKAGKLFATEAANWNVLRHENIVRLLNYNIFPVPYLESELCDGSIEREMSHGPVTVERAIEIVKQVARGLSYAHERKILHGDIKPSNMLLRENIVKISDWGLSKLKTEQSVSIAGVTLQYAAPEELSRQFGRADERTDIYQLGVLFYQLVTGKLPFADDGSLVDAILQETPIPPSQIRPISPELETIILTCLRKRKEERYQSMDQLLTALGGVNN